MGYKIPQIVEKLAEESRRWSENTIKADLHSAEAKDYLEELQRQQFADIALTKSRKIRLEYRDRMIERFTPRKSPDTAVNVQNNIQVKSEQTQNVDNTVLQLLKRHNEFVAQRSGRCPVSGDGGGEQVDPSKTDVEAGRIP
jgi:hypothetical protein